MRDNVVSISRTYARSENSKKLTLYQIAAVYVEYMLQWITGHWRTAIITEAMLISPRWDKTTLFFCGWGMRYRFSIWCIARYPLPTLSELLLLLKLTPFEFKLKSFPISTKQNDVLYSLPLSKERSVRFRTFLVYWAWPEILAIYIFFINLKFFYTCISC